MARCWIERWAEPLPVASARCTISVIDWLPVAVAEPVSMTPPVLVPPGPLTTIELAPDSETATPRRRLRVSWFVVLVSPTPASASAAWVR